MSLCPQMISVSTQKATSHTRPSQMQDFTGKICEKIKITAGKKNCRFATELQKLPYIFFLPLGPLRGGGHIA